MPPQAIEGKTFEFKQSAFNNNANPLQNQTNKASFPSTSLGTTAYNKQA